MAEKATKCETFPLDKNVIDGGLLVRRAFNIEFGGVTFVKEINRRPKLSRLIKRNIGSREKTLI